MEQPYHLTVEIGHSRLYPSVILILIYSRSIDHKDVELVKKGVQVVV